jgi:hypothetical protein
MNTRVIREVTSGEVTRKKHVQTKLRGFGLQGLARKRTIPTEQPPLVGEVNANFCG